MQSAYSKLCQHLDQIFLVNIYIFEFFYFCKEYRELMNYRINFFNQIKQQIKIFGKKISFNTKSHIKIIISKTKNIKIIFQFKI